MLQIQGMRTHIVPRILRRRTMRKDPFLSVLIEKLNRLKRDQDVRERLADSLQELKIRLKCSGNSIETSTSSSTKKSYSVVQERKNQSSILISKSKRAIEPTGVSQQVQRIRPNSQLTSKSTQKPREKIISQPDYTVVGYCFAGNPVPYSTKVRGRRITLGHFKTLFNRKGNYRFFFKRYSNEFGTNIVFEEVTDDEDVLPLWDGKIFALIEELEEYRF